MLISLLLMLFFKFDVWVLLELLLGDLLQKPKVRRRR